MKKILKNNSQKSTLKSTIRPYNEDSFFDNIITIEEVAEALRLSPKTIQNWISARKIPFVRTGGRTFFYRKRLITWIERKEFKKWQ